MIYVEKPRYIYPRYIYPRYIYPRYIYLDAPHDWGRHLGHYKHREKHHKHRHKHH